jgi:hypothetical protein
MIRTMDGLPEGVTGFELSGKIRAEDYRDVVLPALEQAFAAGEVRCVIAVPDFGGMAPGALWEDLKMGFGHLKGWRRIALVSDLEWVNHTAALFGWLTPGELKIFPLAEQAEAVRWAAG